MQCYTTNKFNNCVALADRLNAVVSLFHKKTLRYKNQLGTRNVNVFLWPHSERYWRRTSQDDRLNTPNANTLRFSLPIFPTLTSKVNNFLFPIENEN